MNNENILATRYLLRNRQIPAYIQLSQPTTFPTISNLNRNYYVNKLITEYSMSYSNAIEYLEQLYHIYITYNPNCPFDEFLDVITRIFYK